MYRIPDRVSAIKNGTSPGFVAIGFRGSPRDKTTTANATTSDANQIRPMCLSMPAPPPPEAGPIVTPVRKRCRERNQPSRPWLALRRRDDRPRKGENLGKGPRVILDEAEVVGLSGVVDMKAAMDLHKVGEQEIHKQKINLSIRGRESPPKLHEA